MNYQKLLLLLSLLLLPWISLYTGIYFYETLIHRFGESCGRAAVNVAGLGAGLTGVVHVFVVLVLYDALDKKK